MLWWHNLPPHCPVSSSLNMKVWGISCHRSAAPGSRVGLWCSELCQGAIKISQDLGPELGMFPAWAPVKVRPSQNYSTKSASSGLFSLKVIGIITSLPEIFPGLHYLNCFPFSMPKNNYFSLFCLLRVELKPTEQQAVCKGNDK